MRAIDAVGPTDAFEVLPGGVYIVEHRCGEVGHSGGSLLSMAESRK
jgi:hypothetical protein